MCRLQVGNHEICALLFLDGDFASLHHPRVHFWGYGLLVGRIVSRLATTQVIAVLGALRLNVQTPLQDLPQIFAGVKHPARWVRLRCVTIGLYRKEAL